MKSVYASVIRVIVALLLASIIWVFVSFTENPQQTTPLINLPVIAEGLPDSMTLVDNEGRPIPVPDDVINLTVSGPQDTLARITKANVQPYINLSGLEPGIHQVDVQVRTVPRRDGLDFRALQPAAINVTIEAVISATVPLTLTTSGQPPTSYEAGTPSASVDNQPITSVTVSGPSSQVQKVVGGHIELDLSSQTTTLRTRRKIIAVDENGREVEGVTVTPELADVELSIVSSSGLKRVPIVYVVSNNPPAGVRPLVNLSPAFVTIVGSSQRLDQVDFVETEPFALPDTASVFSTTVKLRFPFGVTPLDTQAAAATLVRVEWQPIDLQIRVQVPVITRNVSTGLSVQITPNVLEVELVGNNAALQQPTALSIVVDLRDKPAGTYQIQPTIQLPQGLVLLNPLPTITVVLVPIAVTPTPAPPPTNPPSTAAPTPTGTLTSPPIPATPTTPISPTVTP